MAQVSDGSCIAYYELNLYSSGKKQIVTRKYPKIISTLGEIGGNRELIFLAIFLLYKYIRDYQFYKHKKQHMCKLTCEKEAEKYLRRAKCETDANTTSV